MAFQGIPGVPEGFAGQPANQTFDPLLLPRWYLALSSTASNSGVDQVINTSPEAYLAANPRADATGVVTISGTPGTGDIVALTLTNKVLPGGSLTVSYTAPSAITVAVYAAELAKLFNANQVARAFGITASTIGTGVLTIAYNGPVGNYTVGTKVVTQVGGSTAAAWASSGAFTGGTGPVVPLSTFSAFPETNGVTRTMQFFYGRPIAIDSGILATLNTAGLPLG